MIVILFGGGDGGGLIIGPSGVQPIPPFDPALRNQLQSLAKLVYATRGVGPGTSRDRLMRLLNELSVEVVGAVELAIGELGNGGALIYTDDIGGFTCGSTGKPPIPFPWPPANMPPVDRLVRLGLVNREAVDLLRAAAEQQADIVAMLRDPRREAERLKLPASQDALAQIRGLGLGDPGAIADPVDREVVEFFHRAAGQYALMERWAAEPLAVADELGIQLSNEAARRIVSANAANNLGAVGGGAVMSPAAVAIVVVIVIVVWTREAEVAVSDRSGLEKF